jgi:hypothetical protein
MNKYFDIIDYNLLSNSNTKNLENIFSELNISTVYVCKYISSSQDTDNFNIPSSNLINFKKMFLVKDISLLNKLKNKNVTVVCKADNISQLSKFLNNKSCKYVVDPIFDKLGFDEGSCNICLENSLKIIFNLNLFRTKSYKSIKQGLLIFKILQKHKIDFCFASFANKTNEIIDPNISKCFLENLNVNSSLLNKIFKDNYEI